MTGELNLKIYYVCFSSTVIKVITIASDLFKFTVCTHVNYGILSNPSAVYITTEREHVLTIKWTLKYTVRHEHNAMNNYYYEHHFNLI